MRHPRFVASATLAIAVSFGIARYGFGLFLPDIASSFALGHSDLGLISSGSYLGYLAASLAAMLWTSAVGARAMLAAGMLVAAAGMSLVALASSPWILIAGFLLAGASPGLVFAPVSEAIGIAFEAEDRGPVFSGVNAGEGIGAVLSAIALVLLGAWQTAWGLFAGLGALCALCVYLSTPARPRRLGRPAALPPLAWLLKREAWPLLFASFLLGLTTTVFWTFAGGLVAERRLEIPPLRLELRGALWLVLGVAGMAGVVAAPLLRRYGPRTTYAISVLSTAAALCLSGAAAASASAVLLCGGLFGLAYIMATSQIGAWAIALYAARPSSGFGLTFLVFATGAVAGPALAGRAAETVGLAPTFVGAGLLTLSLLLFLPRSEGKEKE